VGRHDETTASTMTTGAIVWRYPSWLVLLLRWKWVVVAGAAAVEEDEEVHTRGGDVRSSSVAGGVADDFPVAAAAGAKIDKDHPAAFEQHAIVLVPVAAVADLLDSSLVAELLLVEAVALSVVGSCYYHPTTTAAAVGKTAAVVVLVHYRL
jgi:hypothetical protein